MTLADAVMALVGGLRISDPTIDAALTGGAASLTVGEAFLHGYKAALRALVPLLPPGNVCLCATEEGGAHPKAIQTILDGNRVRGRKKWVTGGAQADWLLVVASVGLDGEGKNRLRLARVSARAPGVTLHPMPETPFTPEIPHAEVSLEDAPVEAVLPGDGYDRYVKPFRTIEDCHVFAAVIGYVFGVARRHGWPADAREKLLGAAAAFRACALQDPSSPPTHLALAGALALGRMVLADIDPHWALSDETTQKNWRRDSVLLTVAQKARTARAESAWKLFAK